MLERVAGELIREKRESREVREGAASGCVTGERAEMSWTESVVVVLDIGDRGGVGNRTKERR